MCDNDEEILIPIKDDDLPQLAELYKKHCDWAPHIYSFLNTAIKWRQKGNKTITLMSLNDCWKEDGTFIALIECQSYDLFIFTLDKSKKNLYNGLKNSKKLFGITNTLLQLYATHSDFVPLVYNVFKEKQLNILRDTVCYMYCIDRLEAAKFEVIIPEHIYYAKLDISMTSLINSLWPHRYPGSEQYLGNLIEYNGGYGLFLKNNKQLVAWVVINPLGQIGMLQTVEEFKRNGFGSILLKIVSNDIAENGFHPFGTVLKNNTISQKVFEKNGFKSLGECNYISTIL